MKKKFIISAIAVLMMALLYSSMGGAQIEPTPSESPLIGKLTFAGSTTVQPLMTQLTDVFHQRHPQVLFDVAAGGSVVGIQAVHQGTVDIGMASRALSSEESQGIKVYTFAKDVIAMIVHPDNPVKSITLAQLQDIYMGRITNWQQLGGNDLAIIPVQRELSSGTRGAFDELALGNQQAAAPKLLTVATNGDAAAEVASEPAAIGYVGLGYLNSSVKAVAINGIFPSKDSVRDGTFPLVRPLSLLTGPLSQPLANDFINFVLSPEGQSYVEQFGWISVRK